MNVIYCKQSVSKSIMQAVLDNSTRTSLSPLSQNKQVWPGNDTLIVQKPTHENTK